MDYGLMDDKTRVISCEELKKISEQQTKTLRECMEIQKRLKKEAEGNGQR